MRNIVYGTALLAAVIIGCSGSETTTVRKETVRTEPAPVIVEKHTTTTVPEVVEKKTTTTIERED